MATRLTTILVIVIVGATFIAGLMVGAQHWRQLAKYVEELFLRKTTFGF